MKSVTKYIILALILVGGIFIFTKGDSDTKNVLTESDNVTISNGVQIVEIKTKGGYTPRTSIAKSGIPTILRFNTDSTFDCSSAVRIPSYNISQNLPISGLTDIELPASQTGILKGSCGMGMYPFEIIFQD